MTEGLVVERQQEVALSQSLRNRHRLSRSGVEKGRKVSAATAAVKQVATEHDEQAATGMATVGHRPGSEVVVPAQLVVAVSV